MLTERELAEHAATSTARIRQLVDIGVLHPDGDGYFAPGDIQRVRIIDAFDSSGIDVDYIAHAVREGRMTFAFTDRIYPPASPPSGRTVGALAADLGLPLGELSELFVALGVPRPGEDGRLTVAD